MVNWWLTISRSQAHVPYDQAGTIEDLRNGLYVVRAFLQMGRYSEATKAYIGELSRALSVNLEADVECLAILRQFFTKGWISVKPGLKEIEITHVTYHAAYALDSLSETTDAITLYNTALRFYLQQRDWRSVAVILFHIANLLNRVNRFARRERCILRALDIAVLENSSAHVFMLDYIASISLPNRSTG